MALYHEKSFHFPHSSQRMRGKITFFFQESLNVPHDTSEDRESIHLAMKGTMNIKKENITLKRMQVKCEKF
jgi:hypothetical protein